VTTLRISVLGPMEFAVAGRPVRVSAPQTRAVLAALVVGSGSVVPLDRIIDTVWGESPPRSAVLKVQGYICALRKSIRTASAGAGVDGREAECLIATRRPGYLLSAAGCSTDLGDFTALVKEAEDKTAAGDIEAASALLGRALSSWRGPAFADVPGERTRVQAERLERLRTIAVEDKALHDLRLGRSWTVLEELGPELDANPFGERSRELLIRAYLRLGQRHAALSCYETGRLLLRRELGVEPGLALQQLASMIRGGADLRMGSV
jgi:DNA-binding SARP family transcriptional activator